MSFFSKLFKPGTVSPPVPATGLPVVVTDPARERLPKDADPLAAVLLDERDQHTRWMICQVLGKLGKERVTPRALGVLWYRQRLTQMEGGIRRVLEADPEKYGKVLRELGHGELADAAFGWTEYGNQIPACWQLLLSSDVDVVVAEALTTLDRKTPSSKHPVKCPDPVLDQMRLLAQSSNPDSSRLAMALLERLRQPLNLAQKERKAVLDAAHRDAEHDAELAALIGELEQSNVSVLTLQRLAAFGARAKKALPALHRVLQEASRPVQKEDFEEQRQMLGGIRESAWDRIDRGDPLDAKLAEAARQTIAALEKV